MCPLIKAYLVDVGIRCQELLGRETSTAVAGGPRLLIPGTQVAMVYRMGVDVNFYLALGGACSVLPATCVSAL